MVKINNAKVFFLALGFTYGAGVVYAQAADVAVANTPVGVKAKGAVVAQTNLGGDKSGTKAVTGKATEMGADPSVVVEISAPPATTGNVATSDDVNPFAPSVDALTKVEVNKSASGSSAGFEGFDMASDSASMATSSASPSEQLLGPIEDAIFKEMADIERETALLTLKAKRDRLLADIERAKADLRRNQMDEMERREQIVRDRVKWEIEQEEAAKLKAKLEAEEKAAAEREKIKEEQPNRVFENEEDITLVYTIREIKGINGDLVAVLNSEKGSFDATVGYPLKNGFKVVEITPSAVKIQRGEDIALLLFSEGGSSTGSVAQRGGNSGGSSGGARTGQRSTSRSSSVSKSGS